MMYFSVSLSNGKTFYNDGTASLLDSARSAGLLLEHSCRIARCGLCKVPVLAGTTVALRPEVSLSATELADGIVLSCCRAATSNVILDTEDLGPLANIRLQFTPCRIAAISYPAPGLARIGLRLPPGAQLVYLPGQYVNVVRGTIKRSYSLANAPRADGTLDLIVREIDGGVLSAYWFGEAMVNDLLRLEGPVGTFFLRDSPGPVAFLATGTGIAPVAAIIEGMRASGRIPGREISVYWGNRSAIDLVPIPALEQADIRFVPVLSRTTTGWTGRSGYVQAALLDDVSDLSKISVYACGSPAMIDDSRRMLIAAGLSGRRFHADPFVTSN